MADKKQVSDKSCIEETESKWKDDPKIKTLIKGMIITLPIIITIFLISVLLNLIFTIISPISFLISPGSEEPHWVFSILSLVILLGIFFLIGLGVKTKMGRFYQRHIEQKYLMHIPLYTMLKDLVEQFTGLTTMPFSQVVLIDTFDSGVLMTGFVTEEVNDDIFTVFVPTAPNPTNGNIYHVPRSRLKFMDVQPESAMRTIVGMGTGSQCLFDEPETIGLAQGDE